MISAPRALGAHIRRIGEDAIRGDEIVEAGSVLGPLQLAAIAAAGVNEVVVSRLPRVVIVSTGSELVTPGETLLHGQIPESNGTLLAGLVAETGAIVARREVIPDDGGRLTALLEELAARPEDDRIDAVVFSGGVSAGAHDVVKQTLPHALAFNQVRMQPGRPQAFGRLNGDCLGFGLPGNPVSVAVSFEAFVRPALLAMQGRTVIDRPLITLPAACAWRTPVGRRQYLPVVVDRADPRRWSIQSAMPRGSHRAGGLARADAYAVVPADVDAVDTDDLVDVMLIS
ncbi:molybdopterin molybdotransferase MoeA [Microbacterium sp. A196]|uniref:molybdopterin molybdotransferase MoeA n=1 Tax=Microbacterium sp. A196 TaxID=3457320 RepID=UPI003FD38026